MKEIKIRYSKQRELIFNNLKHRYDHPTAEMIYQDLKVDYPHLSLGTVYRNFPDMKKITAHGFRHTHASLLFESGANIKEVQERLGHSTSKMTLDIYTHVTQNRSKYFIMS